MRGIHQVLLKKKTTSYIVKDGICDYQVVIPKDCSDLVKKAAEELVFFFREATGYTLPIVDDSTVGFRPPSKHFAIGNMKERMFDRAKIFEKEIVIDKELLGPSGARVLTHGKTVFMFGATDTGTLYAVYEFLKHVLNFDYYFTNLYTIDKVKTLPFYELDITEVPDVPFHTSGYRFVDETNANRFRRRGAKDYVMEGMTGHNSMKVMDVNNTLEKHPLWFNKPEKPDQVCYTAHGDQKEYKAMVERAATTFKEAMKRSPNLAGHCATTDNGEFCTCPACQARYDKYGSVNATIIPFLNDVKRNLDAWMETEEGKPYARDLKIVFYAYWSTAKAPAYKDEKTGEYKILDDSVKCIKGVVPMCAFIEMKYSRPYEDPANAEYHEWLNAWKACANQLQFYFYDTNFHYYLAPYESVTNVQSYYRVAVENNTPYLHNLGQTGNWHPTGFATLKVYLQSKLAWDVDIDTAAYTDKFFAGFFGPANEPMRKLFDSWLKVAYDQPRKLGWGEKRNVECYANPLDKKFWPKKTLLEWLSLTDEAMKKIQPLITTDVEMYDKYAKNVIAERIFVKYLLVELYNEDFSEEQIVEWKKSVRSDCQYVGIYQWIEQGLADYLWKTWGIA